MIKMDLNGKKYYRDSQKLQDECEKYLYYHTTLTMRDGSSFDGIIEKVDDDIITVLVGEDVIEQENENQYDQQRQKYGYGNPRRRFRRFRRRNFPLGNLVALALLPYIVPPIYPYNPYY
jgi:hypothetical protein